MESEQDRPEDQVESSDVGELPLLPAHPLSRRQAWFDLIAVVLVAVLPALVWALAPEEWLPYPFGFGADMLSLALSSLPVVALCVYIIWHSPAGRVAHGIVKFRPVRDVLYAVGLLLAYMGVWWLFFWEGSPSSEIEVGGDFGTDFPMFAGGWHWPVMILGYTMNSLAEEGAIRVLIASRLERLTRDPIASVLFANLLFASYHIYQGVGSATFIFCFGVVLSLVYRRTGSVWPIILGHTFVNIALTVIPY